MNPHASLARLAERFDILAARDDFVVLDEAVLPSFAAAPGLTLLVLAEDPGRVPETWDLAIILPELVRSLRAADLRVGLLMPDMARAHAPRYGITLWPALLLLRDGEFVGTIEGLKDWAVYRARLAALLDAPATRPPGIGIPVRTLGTSTGTCH